MERILRLPEVEGRVGVVASTLYRWMAKGDFPASVKLGPRAVGWRQSDIENWLASRATTDPLAKCEA